MPIQDINKNEFKKLFEIAMDVAHVGYWEWDIKTNDVLWSRQKIEIYGEDADNYKPSFEKFLNVIDDETKEIVFKEIEDVLSGKKDFYNLEHKIKLKNGKVVWVHEKAFLVKDKNNKPIKMIGIVYDVTDKILAKEKLDLSNKYAKHLETHDQLTNLLNKKSLFENVDALIAKKEKFSLLFLDIDNFKMFNNTYGHIHGDLILQKSSEILKRLFSEDLLYRYSADEFVLLLDSSYDITQALQSIKLTFMKPFTVSGIQVKINFSIGISEFPKDANSTQNMITDANTALQIAKNMKNGTALFYNSDMGDDIAQQHFVLEELEKSVKNESFIPYYQAKVDSRTKAILSFEALVRMQSNSKVIPPNLFLGIATKNNIINDIDYIMLKKSLHQLRQWHDMGKKVSVSVNFTTGDFNSMRVFKLLEENSDLLQYLTIEVTESELMSLNMQELQSIDALKNLSIKLSLDDFGTGYSSLQYIHKLPLDEIKVDKAFVDKIPGHKKDEDLVRIIKSIADTFNLKCVVEGVETKEQIDFFSNLGIHTIQGYFYSKPVDAKTATKLLVDGL
ncbi:EAL domain-containing protein [Sulfurimonas sediminis]|uniref:EAL domain-containing protein n=1 Tax=Sulfurimonas sediminis TaxID=2590020 RepID=A0A7M1B2E7_9BACT|nr:GGDEF domain-containing phosphodiesterase [Sulfurimonas sediminis]QOP43903.1 EAL domain-containing protein [Sulfurimonas sediminis]